MNSYPATSVIICLHDYEQYVGQAIASVLGQTDPDFELIVIDDGSSDNSYEVAARFKDERIRLFQQRNVGLGATRNRGISLARGRYIAFLDADDVWTTDKLATQRAFMDSDPTVGLVYSRFGSIAQDGERLSSGYAVFSSKPSGYIQRNLITGNCIGTPSVVQFRRSAIVEYGLSFDESRRFVEDWQFYIQVAAVCKVAYVGKTLAYHRLHDRNMQSVHELMYRQGIHTIEYAADRFRSSPEVRDDASLRKLMDRGCAEIASVAGRECLKTGDMLSAKDYFKQSLSGGAPSLRNCLLYTLTVLNVRPRWVINSLK